MGDSWVDRHFLLTREEDALLESAAKEDGRSKNSFLRAMIRVLQVPAPIDRPARDVLEEMRRVFREERHK